jgi:hypothetical protein
VPDNFKRSGMGGGKQSKVVRIIRGILHFISPDPPRRDAHFYFLASSLAGNARCRRKAAKIRPISVPKAVRAGRTT